jgi:DNA-binding LacI/PurR family transcriptional regulator
VGFLSVPPVTAFLKSSAEAYARWCSEHGQGSMSEVIDPAERDRDEAGAMTRSVEKLFDRTDGPDAVYAPLERVGVEAHRAMLGMRLAIPDDVLLATTHDRGQARTANPPITTIEWDYREVGRRAASLLIDLVEGTRSAPLLEVVPGRLVPRASTAR